MINLIHSDLYKLKKTRTLWILLTISLISSILMMVISQGIHSGKIVSELADVGFLFSDINVINILSGVLAAVFICGSFKDKTFHQGVSSGKSSFSMILSKSFVFFIIVSVILLPYVIVTFIGASSSSGFILNGATEAGFMNILKSLSSSSSDILKLSMMVFSTVIMYLAQVSISIPLALTFKKPSTVIGVNYGLSMCLGNLSRLREVSPLFKTVYDLTPFGGEYPFMAQSTAPNIMLKSIFASLLFIFIILSICLWKSRRMEIH